MGERGWIITAYLTITGLTLALYAWIGMLILGALNHPVPYVASLAAWVGSFTLVTLIVTIGRWLNRKGSQGINTRRTAE